MEPIIVSKPEIGTNGYAGWSKKIGSSGAVSVKFSFKNVNTKVIKYAVFFFTAYNRVGDLVLSADGKETEGVKFTGPLRPLMTAKDLVCTNGWYDNTINLVVVDHVIIEYMDGTTITVEGSEIPHSLAGGIVGGLLHK